MTGVTESAILVVHTGGIGDLLLACPALSLLAAHAPIELLGHRRRLELAVAAGIARSAHELDAVRFESVFHTPAPQLRAFLAEYHRAVVWMRDDDGQIAESLGRCGLKSAQCFPGLPPEGWTRHASAYYLERLGFDTAPAFRLRVPPAEARYDVIIHPGSGGRRKNWPLARFQAVADALGSMGLRVAWSTGPAEDEMPCPASATALRCESLLDLAGHLAAARAYLGNDSGITHLAAAVGTRTAAVFGPTEPAVWAPQGGHVTVLRGPQAESGGWPPVSAAIAAITEG